MLTPGSTATLDIEKPAAGGRMIARADGQVVLVSGAIPGERVRAKVTRVGKGVAYADTLVVEQPSADRREPFTDPACGGCLYAHVAYPRQLDLKRDVIVDAFGRIGRIVLAAPPIVAASLEEGYRMRARLHVRPGRSGASLFREGTHDPCDARATRQLLPATSDAIDSLLSRLTASGFDGVSEIDVSENIDASERAVHLDLKAPTNTHVFSGLGEIEGVTGLTVGQAAGTATNQYRIETVLGDPRVGDTIAIGDTSFTIRRHVLAFFQGNRYLLKDLLAHVTGAVPAGGSVIDLYAGVGVFAVSIAAARAVPVVAVEGDAIAARDLEDNARRQDAGVETVTQSVEGFLGRSRPSPGTLIVDPPRTGMSKEALDGAIRLRAPRIVYVSCDVATLARDSRRLVDSGYELRDIAAFDLFPNTPHVETVVQFDLK